VPDAHPQLCEQRFFLQQRQMRCRGLMLSS
jgi:hypothetical protein